MRLKAVFIFITLILFVRMAAGQDDPCPTLVEQALKMSRDACLETGRNQACYGHALLKAEPQTGVANFAFNRIGDKTSVDSIAALRLSPFDRSNSTWGVALMRLQADLPHTLPGQNVTFVLFGDVAVINNVTHMPFTVDVTATRGINVRGLPRIDAPIVGAVPKGETVVADGRLRDGSWLRVRLPSGPQNVGWVRSDMLSTAGDVAALDATSADDATPRYQPMQAFYLTTGRSSASCKQVPENGVLIQSPRGSGKVNLLINNVNVRMGSTVLFQAEPGNKMTVSTLDGEALVSVNGRQVKAPTGWRVSVPMDEGLNPIAPPSAPQPLDAAELQMLPLQMLEAPVTIQVPASGSGAAVTPVMNTIDIAAVGSIGEPVSSVVNNPVDEATAPVLPVEPNPGVSPSPVGGSSGENNAGGSPLSETTVPTMPPPTTTSPGSSVGSPLSPTNIPNVPPGNPPPTPLPPSLPPSNPPTTVPPSNPPSSPAIGNPGGGSPPPTNSPPTNPLDNLPPAPLPPSNPPANPSSDNSEVDNPPPTSAPQQPNPPGSPGNGNGNEKGNGNGNGGGNGNGKSNGNGNGNGGGNGKGGGNGNGGGKGMGIG
jgi:hypothetical protein